MRVALPPWLLCSMIVFGCDPGFEVEVNSYRRVDPPPGASSEILVYKVEEELGKLRLEPLGAVDIKVWEPESYQGHLRYEGLEPAQIPVDAPRPIFEGVTGIPSGDWLSPRRIQGSPSLVLEAQKDGCSSVVGEIPMRSQVEVHVILICGSEEILHGEGER
ncbi:MAG: hypothetical protein ACREK7_08045 [Gemmatimonadota bacterium]